MLLNVIVVETCTNDNMGVGDIFQILFSDAKIMIPKDSEAFVVISINGRLLYFDIDWWNSPYKRGK